MDIQNLTPEQMAKARECTSVEDMLALAQQEGFELTDEQLEAVAGGAWDPFASLPEFVSSCGHFYLNNSGK